MNKSEKINFIIKILEDFFPKIEIPLDHKDPYTLLIAVLLSAQSTDKGVNKITPILFSKAERSTIGFIAEAGEYNPEIVLLSKGFSGFVLIDPQSFSLIPYKNKLGSKLGEECIAIISPV